MDKHFWFLVVLVVIACSLYKPYTKTNTKDKMDDIEDRIENFEVSGPIVNTNTHLGCYMDVDEFSPMIDANKLGYNNFNYQNKVDPIRECEEFASSLNYPIFGIKDGGKCLVPKEKIRSRQISHNMWNHFNDVYSSSNKCCNDSNNNTGHLDYYFDLYKVGEGTKNIKFKHKGCFKDTTDYRTMDDARKHGYRKNSNYMYNRIDKYHSDKDLYHPSDTIFEKSDKRFIDHRGNYTALQDCANFAKQKGFKQFGIQDGGLCMVNSTDDRERPFEYGQGFTCLNGRGGPYTNDVYELI